MKKKCGEMEEKHRNLEMKEGNKEMIIKEEKRMKEGKKDRV